MSSQLTKYLNYLKDQTGEDAVTRDLLRDLERFFTLIQQLRDVIQSDWLTVENIATELKVSKSVIYRLIRNGQIKAINIVEHQSLVNQRGHYRIHRTSLDKFIAASTVKPHGASSRKIKKVAKVPIVKNHLGL